MNFTGSTPAKNYSYIDDNGLADPDPRNPIADNFDRLKIIPVQNGLSLERMQSWSEETWILNAKF